MAEPEPERGLPPERAAILGRELEAMLSTEPVPPPFWPEEGDGTYAPAPAPGAEFEAAVREGLPWLVDVLSVEPSERDTVVRARNLPDGDGVSILLPANYACTAPGAVRPGVRYLLITERAPGADGHYPLYLREGARHAISEVSADGTVESGAGPRDAESVATAARAS